jgi:aminocarboxymuconate-semialdehyde decarboxylase
MIVDHQSHWYPRAYLDSIVGREAFPRATTTEDGGYLLEPREGARQVRIFARFVDEDEQIAAMDAAGIDVAIKSANLVGDVNGLPAAEARATLDVVNAEVARLQREHPDRIVGTAMLPWGQPGAALEVLDHAVSELGLKAICLLSNVDGHPLGAPETLPVFQRIEELGLPILLHPADKSITSGELLPILEIGVGWMFDTTAAALSLIYNGVLDACPSLRIVHPHLGGVLPFIVGRVEACEAWQRTGAQHPLRHYLRTNFYVDSVGDLANAVPLAIDLYGLDRILFGSDYPWFGQDTALDFVADQGEDVYDAITSNQLLVLA